MKFDTYIGRGFERWYRGEYTPGQLKAWWDFTNSFILLSGAYRSGKSEIGSRLAIRHALSFPYAKVGVFRQHLASLKRSTLVTVLELLHPSWIKYFSNTQLQLELINGSTITFIGAEFSDRLGSIELTYGFIDEAAELTEESLGMIQGRLSGELKMPQQYYDSLNENYKKYVDNTIDKRQLILACNPKSTNHYLYHRFIENPKPGHVAYTSNSISNNNLPEIYLVNNLSAYTRPGISRDWILENVREIRKGNLDPSGYFLKDYLTPFGQRNLLGEWVALEGSIYNLDDKYHIREPDWGQPISYYGGIDFGFHNPRIIVAREHKLTSTDSQDIKYKVASVYQIVEGWSQKEATPDDLINAMKYLDNKYDIKHFYLPHDQPGITKTAKRSLGGSKVKNAKTDVLPGINLVFRFFNQNRITIRSNCIDKDLIWSELNGYSWKQNRDGTWEDKPIKVNDHYPDALRYLIYSRHYKEPEEKLNSFDLNKFKKMPNSFSTKDLANPTYPINL